MSEGRGAGAVVAIVGATGAVGIELIRCLEERAFPLAELRLFASARSAGQALRFRGRRLPGPGLTGDSLWGVELEESTEESHNPHRYAALLVPVGPEATH